MKNILKLEFKPFVIAFVIFIAGLLAFALIAYIISLIAGISYYAITRTTIFWIITVIVSLYIAYLAGDETNEYYHPTKKN